jgi:hypothetical protein
MSRRWILVLGALAALLLAGCIVRTPGPPPPRRHTIEVRPGPRHHRRHCRQVCANWGYERRCSRQCTLQGATGCRRWEQRCDNRRVCRGYRDHCD